MFKLPEHIVFNFSASYYGGGRKRLDAFAQWFNMRGGATFFIHPACEHLRDKFPSNNYFTVRATRLQRLLSDFRYVCKDLTETPDLFYSCGIPIPYPIGRVNWLHVNNVLPLTNHHLPITAFDRLKRLVLGPRLRQSAGWCEVVSVMSKSSIDILGTSFSSKAVVSVQGSDDELASLETNPSEVEVEPRVIVVGTWKYKALDDAFHVFQWLRSHDPELRMHLFGPAQFVPRPLRKDNCVIIRGVVSHAQVMNELRRCRYYLSTTRLENAFGSAAEGIFLAQESLISDIPPHRELLAGEPFETVNLSALDRPLLKVRRRFLTGVNLRSWDSVLSDMLRITQDRLEAVGDC
jgi:glycosyltransferase involved in cell wall biosynthesis